MARERSDYDAYADTALMERHVQYPGIMDLLGKVAVGAKVLDLGCGAGNLTRLIYEAHPGATVFGMDRNPDLLHTARVKYAGPHYLRGDLNALPLREGSVDVVVSNMVFPQAQRDELRGWWQGAHRVLRAGGRAIVSYNHSAFLPYSPKDSDRHLDPTTFDYNDETQVIHITSFHPDGRVAGQFEDPYVTLKTIINTPVKEVGFHLVEVDERTYPPEVIEAESIDPIHGRISNVFFIVVSKSM